MRFGPEAAVPLAFAWGLFLAPSCSRDRSPVGSGARAGALPGSELPARRRVSFRASDGVPIVAWLYPGGRRDAPAVVLAHHLSGDRSEWDAFVREARRATPP